ncbi:hypothetical protein L0F63_004567, partial [Massospora cicadina]
MAGVEHRVLAISLEFLSCSSESSYQSTITSQASCRASVVMKGAEAIQLQWHPLSQGTSLAILDTHSVFRLFEVSKSSSTLQLEWDLARPDLKYSPTLVADRLICKGAFYSDETVIGFSFLPSEMTYPSGWDAFTMVILSRSGLLRSVCPVMPANCLVDKSGLCCELYRSLQQLASSASLYKESDCRHHSLNVQFLSRIISSYSAMEDRSFVQASSHLHFTPLASAPLRAAPYPFSATSLPPPAASLLILSTPRAPILLVGYRDLLVVYALTSSPGPLWAATEQAKQIKPQLTTLELIPLEGVHRMVQDKLRPHVVYCFHAEGVNALNLEAHITILNAQQLPRQLPPPSPSQAIPMATKRATNMALIQGIPSIEIGTLFLTSNRALLPLPSQWFGERDIPVSDKPQIYTWFKDYLPKYLPPECHADSISQSLDQLNQEIVALNVTCDYLQTRQLTQRDLIVKAAEA